MAEIIFGLQLSGVLFDDAVSLFVDSYVLRDVANTDDSR